MLLKDLIQDAHRLLPATRVQSTSAQTRALIRGLLSPGFQAIAVYRIFHCASLHRIPAQPLRFVLERWTEITTGVSIPAEAELGPGLRIHHFGNIIIHPGVRIGARCTLYHDVTLGTDGLTEDAPTLGDDCLIGAGARILGGITLGDRCRVGANAVVVHSHPADAVLVGIPARDVRRITPAGTDDEPGARSPDPLEPGALSDRAPRSPGPSRRSVSP